jgi:hypothetical protein
MDEWRSKTMTTSALHTFDPATYRLDPFYEADEADMINVALADATYVRGTVLGELTATPGKYAAYASGASDGTQTAKGFLRDACVVSSGNVTLKDETGITRKYAAMYYSGVFKTSELTGLDAGGLEDLNANLISGTVADGIIQVG